MAETLECYKEPVTGPTLGHRRLNSRLSLLNFSLEPAMSDFGRTLAIGSCMERVAHAAPAAGGAPGATTLHRGAAEPQHTLATLVLCSF